MIYFVSVNERSKMLKEIKSDIYHLMHPKLTFFLTSISWEVIEKF